MRNAISQRMAPRHQSAASRSAGRADQEPCESNAVVVHPIKVWRLKPRMAMPPDRGKALVIRDYYHDVRPGTFQLVASGQQTADPNQDTKTNRPKQNMSKLHGRLRLSSSSSFTSCLRAIRVVARALVAIARPALKQSAVKIQPFRQEACGCDPSKVNQPGDKLKK